MLRRGGRLALAAAATPPLAALTACGSNESPKKPNWRQLAKSLRGRLLRPGEAGFTAASDAENDLYAKVVPGAVAMCAGPPDVRTAILWARDHGIPLVARSGGHSFGGYSRTTGLQIDLNSMKSASVDPSAGTLRVGGAVRFQELDTVLKPHNLFFPAGQCPPVGVNGFALGGGFGFYSRAHGLTADQLIQTDVVLASGETVTADATHHPDLYWACRGGGGGNFGINTSMTFSLFGVGNVSVCTCEWKKNVESVVNEFQKLFVNAPSTFSLIVRMTPPDHGSGAGGTLVTALGHYFGPSSDLMAILDPVLSKETPSKREFLDLDFWSARHYLADLPGPPHSYVERSRYVPGPMSEAGVAALIDRSNRYPGNGPAQARLDYWLWSGAMDTPAPDATAFVHRNDLSLFAVSGSWNPSASKHEVQPIVDWVNGTWAAVGPHSSDFAYQNFIDPALKDWQKAYYGSNLARLIEVKRRYDPHDLFHFAQSIPTGG
ncbi:MAG: FAD-binding oxidoreductase [Candidatus Dormibacteraceae bacterium]